MSFEIEASIGVALHPNHGHDFETLLCAPPVFEQQKLPVATAGEYWFPVRDRRYSVVFTDDLLDVSGDEQALGKRTRKDADHGKLTFPALLGIDESRRRAAGLIAEACAALDEFLTSSPVPS